jgi:ABC-type glycerol-3-phosphate transport system substrate-binding protein
MTTFRSLSIALALILACAVTLPQAQAQTETQTVTVTVSLTIPQGEYDSLNKVATAQRSQPKEDPVTHVITQTPLYANFEEFFAAQVGQFMQQMYDRLGASKPAAVSELEKQLQALQDQLTVAKKVPVTVTKQAVAVPK